MTRFSLLFALLSYVPAIARVADTPLPVVGDRDPLAPLPLAAPEQVALPRYDLSLGLHAGLDYYYPVAHAQFVVTDRITLGVQPFYASFAQPIGTGRTIAGESRVTSLGAFLTGSIYLSGPPFAGIFLQGTAGALPMTVTAVDSATRASTRHSFVPFATSATINWRVGGVGFDLGVGAGFQYVGKVPDNVPTRFRGLLPLVTGFLGANL